MPSSQWTYNLATEPKGPPHKVSRRLGPDTGHTVGWLVRIMDPGSDFRIEDVDFKPIAHLTAERDGKRHSVHRIDDEHGALLARITRRRRRFRRTVWEIQPAAGPAVRAVRGRLVWWAVWLAYLPVNVLIGAIPALLLDDDAWVGTPRRLIWRDSSHRAHITYRGVADEFQVHEEGWDPRLVSALVGIHALLDPPTDENNRRM
ncbi:hypothetical protein G5C51_26805 [Streptomyces sp. A7024]|uniref:Uncharacterized protein n=1 Tax=Streptomyces coryli TaxID=1128680 RepID=A0A6G4U681_9ACTN|nr:hypothetical protein [Streptomyces coryli]NGN67502.1 hypothetical protein [Streptomyces coryli]